MLGPAQRLDTLRALRLMTSQAAHISFEEQRKGTLEAGKFADLAVLSANPLTTPADELGGIEVLQTFVDGRIVHASGQRNPTEIQGTAATTITPISNAPR